MTWTHCAECARVQECAEADCCMNEHEAKQAAEERRKLLAGNPDGGVIRAFALITRWLAAEAGVEPDDVIIGFACKDDATAARIKAQFTHQANPRLDDLTHRLPAFAGVFKLMGIKGQVVTAPKDYKWPMNS